MSVLAFDFGGTKLAAALIDLDHPEKLDVHRAITPAEEGPDAVLAAMFQLGKQACFTSNQKPTAVGISYGGPVTPDRQRCVLSNHIPGWVDFPLVEIAERGRCNHIAGVFQPFGHFRDEFCREFGRRLAGREVAERV